VIIKGLLEEFYDSENYPELFKVSTAPPFEAAEANNNKFG